ncbi:hypothetical protein CDL12_27028 [Handroanthus impetiginosus]|uniref:Uncharacterized protein n=1 Tax=Handroanthus impetiginosus TaxID=429701 RepID=A0A2G9G574_9LAMI|nr:hypothetical protein CDL12_27028 [Handroanthus impetiginosus]
MAMICGCGSFRHDESSSLRRLGRSNSTLVESELVTSEVARIIAYERLSKSMRYTHESSPEIKQQQYCKKRTAWTSVLKVFSNKKVGNVNWKKRQTTVETVAEPPRVAATDANKRRSSWLPNPHRRWPVQGW